MTMILTIKFLINLFAFLIWEDNSTGHEATVSGLFKKEGIAENCKLGGKDCMRVDENAPVYGPKFQKVHLELPRINPVRTGYERNVRIMKDRKHNMKTLAIYPPIYEIKDFLSNDECDAIIYLAKEKGLSEVTATAKSVNLSPAHGNRAFDQWDQDFNGLLSPKEISEIFEIKHLLFTEEDVIKMYKDLDMDQDKDGQISYGELERVTFPKFIKYFEDESSQLANASVYNIEETKLWHDEDEMLVFDDVFQNYHQRLSNLTRIPKKLLQESEPLKVSLFKNGSYSQCDHDSDPFYTDMPCCMYGSAVRCRKCRFLSIMYFLNDVEDGGELVFPLADNRTFYWNDLHKDTAKACSKSPNISNCNLVIKPEKGKAIMWYNHYIGRDTGWVSTIDPLSFYGGNHVKGAEKWIATTWVNIVGDGVNDLRSWRMGSNLLSQNNKRRDIIAKMRNDEFIEGEEYLHDSKLTAMDADDDDDENIANDNNENAQAENDNNKDDNNESHDADMNNADKEEIEINIDNEIIDENKQPGIAADEKEAENVKVDENEAKSKEPNLEINANASEVKKLVLKKEENESVETNEDKATRESENKTDNEAVESKAKLDEKVDLKSIKADKTPEKEQKLKSGKNRSPEKGEGPLGPPTRITYPNDLIGGKMIENRLVTSVIILLEELSRDEMEIVARILHEKLQLACIPLMVNPFGPMH